MRKRNISVIWKSENNFEDFSWSISVYFILLVGYKKKTFSLSIHTSCTANMIIKMMKNSRYCIVFCFVPLYWYKSCATTQGKRQNKRRCIFFKSEHWSRPSIRRQKRNFNKQKPYPCGRKGNREVELWYGSRKKNGPKNIIVQMKERKKRKLILKTKTSYTWHHRETRKKKEKQRADPLKTYTTRPKAK